jgi:hypothetical protein
MMVRDTGGGWENYCMAGEHTCNAILFLCDVIKMENVL